MARKKDDVEFSEYLEYGIIKKTIVSRSKVRTSRKRRKRLNRSPNLVEDNGVWFDEVKHSYVNKDGEKYTSVTKFLEYFKQPFDEPFWLTYKAIERIMLAEDHKAEWVKLKLAYLKSNRKEIIYTNAEEINKIFDLNSVRMEIKAEWDAKKEKSLKKGTKFHNWREERLRKKYNHRAEFSGIDLTYPNLLSRNTIIYPELRLYSHRYKLAGSADFIKIYPDGKFLIKDYKTSAKIDLRAFKNPFTKEIQMMREPISHLEDCNFVHYMLQIGIYSYMLEEAGYVFDRGFVEHILSEEKELGKMLYPVNYLDFKRSIITMLDYWEANDFKLEKPSLPPPPSFII